MLNRFAHDRLFPYFFAVMLCVLLPASASAQTSGKGKQLVGDRFERIALDKNDPEVVAIERSRPLGLFQSHTLHADTRFLVDLDPTKATAAAPMPLTGQPGGNRSANSRKIVSYDKDGAQATELGVEYPSLQAQLRCYWSYNRTLADLLAVADAKAREAALESKARRRAGVAQSPGHAWPGSGRNPSTRSQLLVSGDPEMGTLIRARRQFKKAGRPCQVEVLCVSRARNDDSFAERIRLFRRERNACKARADELAAAMRIIRTGE